MAVVTSDFLTGLLTNFRALFAQAFEAAQALQGWQELVIKVPSNGERNTYNWFGTPPKMEDVTHGSVTKSGLRPFNFSVVNLEWQNAIEVERAALERDQLGLITPRIRGLAQEAARHPGELVLDLVRQNANAYDGAAFFADTRVIGASANIDNNLTGAGITVANFQADLAAARAAMRLFQDDNGRPMNLVGNVIMVPPALEQVAYQALNANQGTILNPVVPASENGLIQAATYRVIANPFLTDTTDWFLFHVGPGEDRPFIWQTEKDPELLSHTDPNSEFVITYRKFVYSGYARYNAAMTDPRYGVRIVNV